MPRRVAGQWVTVSTAGAEVVRAFVPAPLPPDPPLHLEGELREILDHALLGLGRLDGIASLLPDTDLFLYMYVRKEAVLSSQIEGTQSSLADLLLFELDEAPGAPVDEVEEVSNYVAAMEHGLRRLRAGFPLCNRLLREIHGILLATGRGAEREPGEFRRSQNWIGGTRPGVAAFVPPPPDRVPDCMSDLERFLHDKPSKTQALVKAALAHVQFETIHPFLDGNGRLGRLLITLLLCSEGVLQAPLLYLSLYLKAHRSKYYELLQLVRVEGDWEAWLSFFVHGVLETTETAVATARQIAALFEEDRGRIQNLGRPAGSALRVHTCLERRPIATIRHLSKETGLSVPTTTSALHTLEQLGIAKELTGRKRGRLFGYSNYLNLLSEGVEAAPG